MPHSSTYRVALSELTPALPAPLRGSSLVVVSSGSSSFSSTLSRTTDRCCACTMFAADSVFRPTRLLRQSFSSHHKIVIPPLSSLGGPNASPSPSSSTTAREYAQHRHLSPDVAQFLPPQSAAEVQRAHQVDAFRASSDALTQQLWKDSKSHLRKQQKLVDEFGVEGAVRESLQPTTTSFREQLRQRPLDRAILQEIYMGLHGRRIERKLKRGVSWEHWITKGDGTAPVFNTSEKAQQTFAFGGDIRQVRCATHPQQFPVVLSHASRVSTSAAGSTTRTSPPPPPPHRSKTKNSPKSAKTNAGRSRQSAAARLLPRESLLPEVAVIGRTSSGKSSLINAVLNASVSPYGHLRGTTDALRFYSVANRLMLVDCPGYGHYDPMATPAIDAENAVKAMRAYLACGAAPGAMDRRRLKEKPGAAYAEGRDKDHGAVEASAGDTRTGTAGAAGGETMSHTAAFSSSDESHCMREGRHAPVPYQPRNLRRVLVCVSAHGMQHLDFAYCDLLESYQIPFSVVLTKTDAAPIRFLARLTDYTRSQLVRYTQCKEILLTSSLRIAGIDKVQELLGSFAATDDPLHGATTDFSAIV